MKKRFVIVTTSHAGEGRNRVSVAAVPHVASPASYSHIPSVPANVQVLTIGIIVGVLVTFVILVIYGTWWLVHYYG